MGGPEGTGRPRPGRGTEVLGGAYDDPRLGQISQPDPHVTVGCAPVIDADELPTADHAPAILSGVPRGQLITTGPFTLVKHPLYTGVALLVLPWAGFLLDTWLGAALGSILYVATRM